MSSDFPSCLDSSRNSRRVIACHLWKVAHISFERAKCDSSAVSHLPGEYYRRRTFCLVIEGERRYCIHRIQFIG